jgi:cell wall-associated NlpC family hydrolase
MRQVAAFLAAAAAVLTVATSATADPSVASKQAQAQAILAQVEQMDMQLERAVEAYNGATVQLNRIDGDLQRNARHLVVAKRSLKTAQTRIAGRLRELYVNGGTGGVVEIVLGAESLDDLLNRIDMVERVGAQDAKVVAEVKRFQREVRAQKVRLQKARTAQASVVAERADQKHSIEGQLAERQRLLASVRSEISRLQAAERERAAEAAAAARARLTAQREQARISAQLDPELTGEAGADPGSFDFGSETPAFIPPPPDGSRASQVIAIAMQYLGVPYVWGGASPATGFDCSGFVMYVFAQIGVSLPHHAAAQYGYGVPVSRDQLQAGDLVFFNGLGHIGVYVGGGQFIHAPHTGDVVKISSLYESWYASTWVGGRRLL